MEGEEAPTWFHQPFPAPMDVNWQQEGDEWLHHLWVALSEQVELTGHGMTTVEASPEFPAVHYMFTPTSEQLNSQLRLVPLKRGLLVVISGTGNPEAIEADQIEPWTLALEEASRRIGQRHNSFDWTAVVGALAGSESNSKALSTEASIRSLRLYPASRYIEEYTPSGLSVVTCEM
jgi:hypothetical protein